MVVVSGSDSVRYGAIILRWHGWSSDVAMALVRKAGAVLKQRPGRRIIPENNRFAELERRIEEDYHAMRPWLPAIASDVLDIGSGHYPLIDIWLFRHYSGNTTIHLLDGDEYVPGGKGGLFAKNKQPYNSRHIGLAFLREKLPEAKLYEHAPDRDATIPCDLIVSRRAWGHHFPIGVYMGLVDRSLRPGGRVITDIRNRTTGMQVFNAYGFRVLAGDIEVRSTKCRRVVLSR